MQPKQLSVKEPKLPTLNEKDYFVVSFCVCIEFSMPKDNIKALAEKTLAINAQNSKQNKENQAVFEQSRKPYVSLSTSYQRHILHKDRFRSFTKMTTMGTNRFQVSEFSNFLGSHSTYFDFLSDLGTKDLTGTSCVYFTFDTKSHIPVGGLAIPARLEMPTAIQEKVGKVEIGGFVLHFSDSPIGVRQIRMSIDSGFLEVFNKTEYRLSSAEGLIEKSFGISKEIISLLVAVRQ